MEGSLVAYKVFTNGSVLNASEINDNLMNQSVIVFSNAAARTAAITSPVEGQLTYLEDVDRYEHWNGSAWLSPFGITFLNKTTFTSAASVSVNNVFTSGYDNYKVLLRISSSSVNTVDINLRARAAGADYSSSNYRRAVLLLGMTTADALSGNPNQTSTLTSIANSSSTLGAGAELTFYSPFLSQTTAIKSTSSGALLYDTSAIINATNSFDGFTIYPTTGNITGDLRVYGLRN
jgi:hypothetical protein